MRQVRIGALELNNEATIIGWGATTITGPAFIRRSWEGSVVGIRLGMMTDRMLVSSFVRHPRMRWIQLAWPHWNSPQLLRGNSIGIWRRFP